MLTPLIAGEPTTCEVLEGTTNRYRAVLRDDTGAIVPSASLVTLLLSLYVIKTDGTIQYLRQDQDVLNLNNVTADANGVLIWILQVSDTTLVEAVPFERHVALFEWSTATKVGKHEIAITVKNLTAVP